MIRFIEKNYWFAWIMVFLCLGTIFYFSSLSNDPVPSIGFEYKSVVYHFGIFFILCFFSMIAFSRGGRARDFIFIAILFCIVYATTDELHQLFVPGRNTDVNDFLVDSAGILMAFVIYIFNLKK